MERLEHNSFSSKVTWSSTRVLGFHLTGPLASHWHSGKVSKVPLCLPSLQNGAKIPPHLSGLRKMKEIIGSENCDKQEMVYGLGVSFINNRWRVPFSAFYVTVSRHNRAMK